MRVHLARAFAWDLRSMKVAAEEAAILRHQGIENEQVHKFLAWRRSILLYVIAPTSLSGLLAIIGLLTLEWSSFTGFGVLVQVLWAASLVALPVAALLASRCWFDARRSRRYMTLAWAFSFLLPIGVSLLPARWVFEMGSAPQEAQVAANFLVGIVYFLNLLPLVLSLMPGILRVSIRVKALLPESLMPGWFTMAAAPFYSLLLLVAFVLILQIAGNAVLLISLAGLVIAPLVFVLRGRLFVQPILTEAQKKSFATVQVIYAVVVGVSVSLLLVFFLTGKVGAMPIVGDEGASMMTYGKFFWQVFKFGAEFTGRSLFITAVAVDYFLMMNLSVWQNMRSVERSEHGAGYDELMGHLGQVLGGPGGPDGRR